MFPRTTVSMWTTLLAVSYLNFPAYAFLPTRMMSKDSTLGISHQEMTEVIIEKFQQKLFSKEISEDTIGPILQARMEISQANADVDQDQERAELHFDGEAFPEGQERILTLRSDIKHLLVELDEVAGARKLLGGALHTTQDFYAHSNWVEMGNRKPNQDLGRFGRPLDRLDEDVATCKSCTTPLIQPNCPDCSLNIVTDRLTSGYYSGENREKPGDHKCSHGGPHDGSTTNSHGGINKDSRDCVNSPHAHLHDVAAGVAMDATEQFMDDISKDLSPEHLRKLLGGQPQVAIVFGSADAAEKFQNENAKTLEKRGASDGQTLFFLTPLDSIKSSSDLSTSTDVSDLTRAVRKHKMAKRSYRIGRYRMAKRGLGDGDEQDPEIIGRVINKVPSGSSLFVHTNKEILDVRVANLAMQRNVRVINVLPEPQSSTSEIHPLNGNPKSISHASGGQTLFAKAAETVRRALTSKRTLVTIFKSRWDGVYSIPIDSNLRDISFSGSGLLEVKGPDGELVPTNKILKSLKPGEYTANRAVVVTAETSQMRILDFHLAKLTGGPGHQGLYPAAHISEKESYTAIAKLSGRPSGLKITSYALILDDDPEKLWGFESMKSAKMREIEIDLAPAFDKPDMFFAENVRVPRGEYHFRITGKDAKGHDFMRQWTRPIQSAKQLVSVSEVPKIDASGIAEYTITIGSGKAGKYKIQGSIEGSSAFKVVGGEASQVMEIQDGRDVEVKMQVKLGDVKSGSATLMVIVREIKGEDIVIVNRALPYAE